MSINKKVNAKSIAKTGARTAGGIIALLLKIIGTLLIIIITTGLIFACIFTVYIKTNLTSELGVSLKDFQMSESSVIYCKNPDTGTYEKLVTLQSKDYRKLVTYDQIPKYAEQALVAIEDKRFYDHHGVDWYRTVAAFGNMFLSMKDNFGGSTITQQLIKNLTEEDDVTVQRKLLEIFRALQFEKDYPNKSDIIEGYLNVVTFGGNTLGIGAAADYYFGKDVSELTLAECASIIGITNNPSQFNPYINEEANKERQEKILNAMYDQGYILTEQELEAAKNEKLVFKKGENSTNETDIYTWFEDAIIEDVIVDLMRVKDISKSAAQTLLFTNGYQIYSTMDQTLQARVDSIYQDLAALPKVGGSSQQLRSSIVLADPYTGEILAMEGDVGEKTANRLYNRATQSRRPPGSSIKPLSVYAPGIEFGVITPLTRYEDSADVSLSGTTWMPNNDDFSFSGVINIRTAVIRSKNTIAAQVIDKLTPKISYNFLVNTLGIELSPFDEDYAPLALGQLTNGITVREMASAYTMFDNNGVRSPLITYSKILQSDGKTIVYENKPDSTVAISDVTAYWVTSMLQDAVKGGTGTGASLGNLMPVAGKTGTTSDNKDRWFAGYTPYYVAVVWTGFDTPAKMVVSFNPAAQLWKKVMTLVHEDLDYKEFTTPPDTYLSPIPGVDEPVSYIVRGVTVDGELLYEITDKTAIKGKNISETANVIEGYDIVGNTDKTITITDDPTNNIFEFYYTSLTPSPSIEPTPDPSLDPEISPSPDVSPDPSASPSETEAPSPTVSPSPPPAP